MTLQLSLSGPLLKYVYLPCLMTKKNALHSQNYPGVHDQLCVIIVRAGLPLRTFSGTEVLISPGTGGGPWLLVDVLAGSGLQLKRTMLYKFLSCPGG